MSVYGNFKTKKECKETLLGKSAANIFLETSMFGKEFKGDGTYPVVGPNPNIRKWYASITVENGIITVVK